MKKEALLLIFIGGMLLAPGNFFETGFIAQKKIPELHSMHKQLTH